MVLCHSCSHGRPDRDRALVPKTFPMLWELTGGLPRDYLSNPTGFSQVRDEKVKERNSKVFDDLSLCPRGCSHGITDMRSMSLVPYQSGEDSLFRSTVAEHDVKPPLCV